MKRDIVIALIIGLIITIPMGLGFFKTIIGTIGVSGAAWMLLTATNPELKRSPES